MGAVCTEEQNIVFRYTRCSRSVVVGVSEGFPKNVEGGAVVTTNRPTKVHTFTGRTGTRPAVLPKLNLVTSQPFERD
jgi:hypothetical protein